MTWFLQKTSFENPIPKCRSCGPPLPSAILMVFYIMCDKMEDDFELHTVKESIEVMKKLGDDV